MTLSPQLQELVTAARELDTEPPEVEDRMWRAIAAAVGPTAVPSTEGGPSSPNASPSSSPNASPSSSLNASPSSSLTTVFKVTGLSLAGVGIAIGIGLASRPNPSAAVPISSHLVVPVVAPSPATKDLRSIMPELRHIAPEQYVAPELQHVAPEAPPTPPIPPHRRSTAESIAYDATDALAEETRMLRRARASVSATDHSRALRILADHAKQFPQGALREARMALEIEALCGAGRNADAERASQRLHSAFPHSALRSSTWCTP